MTYRHEYERVGRREKLVLPVNEESKKGRKRMATPEEGEERERERDKKKKNKMRFLFGPSRV